MYTVRRIGVVSLLKVGLVVGTAAWLLPSLLCGLLGVQAVAVARSLLERLSTVELDSFGVSQLDFVEALGLQAILVLLVQLDNQWGLVLGVLVLGGALVGGLLLGLMMGLVAVVYNLLAGVAGGLELELKLDKPDERKTGLPPAG